MSESTEPTPTAMRLAEKFLCNEQRLIENGIIRLEAVPANIDLAEYIARALDDAGVRELVKKNQQLQENIEELEEGKRIADGFVELVKQSQQ